MDIKRIPIEDLISFLTEEKSNPKRRKTIIECIQHHYRLLKHKALQVQADLELLMLCPCDYQAINKENVILPSGLLLQAQDGTMGITRQLSTRECRVFYINPKTKAIATKPFVSTEWHNYGFMSRIYSYPDHIDGWARQVGSRDLELGMVGRDVELMQIALTRAGASLEINGEFNQSTQNAVIEYQTAHGQNLTGTLTKDDLFELLRK